MYIYDNRSVADVELVIASTSLLAKLLATENITVEVSASTKTAYFDLKNRRLVLPCWYGISKCLRHMLIVHEVGHARDTPLAGWEQAITGIARRHHTDNAKSAEPIVKDYLNVVEDARVDKRQKRRFPGCRRDYAVGLRELGDRNFFGLDQTDPNTLSFIDRANLYFKSTVGQYGLQFSASEKALLARMAETETWDDVVALTDEIYGYAKKHRPTVTVFRPGTDGDKKTAGQGDDENQQNEQVEVEVEDDVKSGSGGDVDDDDADDDAESDKSAGGDDDIAPDCKTGQALRQMLQKMALDDVINYVYIDTPKMNHAQIVDDYTVVLPQMQKSLKDPAGNKENYLQNYRKWRREEQDTVSFLVKEFETRKAADTYARTRISKTGVINMDKLHSYHYNDDVFQRNAVVATGKSHGFVMFLDWSGSMLDHLNATMKQLFSLTIFCRRVGIPFEVYLFRTSSNNNTWAPQTGEGQLYYGPFKLRNVLSSRMSVAQLNIAYELLWLASEKLNFGSDALGNTPLNQTLLAADKLILDFKKRNGVQIVNAIVMTDGASDRLQACDRTMPYKTRGNRLIVRDPVSKTSYTWDDRYHTPQCLEILRARTGANVVGFYLTTSLSDISENIIHPSNRKHHRSEWNREKFITLTSAGYDDYYIINIEGEETNGGFVIQKGMSAHKMMKAFTGAKARKTINRALLTRFITLISKVTKK